MVISATYFLFFNERSKHLRKTCSLPCIILCLKSCTIGRYHHHHLAFTTPKPVSGDCGERVALKTPYESLENDVRLRPLKFPCFWFSVDVKKTIAFSIKFCISKCAQPRFLLRDTILQYCDS